MAKFCRDELSFDYLLDITSVDNFGEEPRFEIVYELYSMTLAVHLRLKLRVSEDEGEVATVSDIWPTANWHEREIYDMMGLRFTGHPDLRRILMWEGYPYFPLRKEFPVEGLPSDMPDVAFSSAAPLEGGPFVTVPQHRDDQGSRAARAQADGCRDDQEGRFQTAHRQRCNRCSSKSRMLNGAAAALRSRVASLAAGVVIGAHLNLHPLPPNVTADRVLVEKAARRLTLLRNGTSAQDLSRSARPRAGGAEGAGRRSTHAGRNLSDRLP